MRLNLQQLTAQLKGQLAPVYLVAGDEALLVEQGCGVVRAAAYERGHRERERFDVEPGFDWDRLFTLAHSPSLFCPRRLLELRVPGVGVGEAGADTLVRLAEAPPADALLLVSAGRLDKRAQGSRWVRALETAGVLVLVYPLEAQAMPRWIEARLRALGLEPARGVGELLAYRFEGNLLGAAQEVDKLAMVRGPGPVTLDDIAEDVGDNGRFNVFNLVDSCLSGDPAATGRALDGLRAEGTEPVLILRMLTREARTLAQAGARIGAGESQARVLETLGWPRRRTLLAAALGRSRVSAWRGALRQAAYADRVLTGRAAGDIWQELQRLALGMCGVRAPGGATGV